MEIDKMSGKTSELPTNFTSTSSSAASSAEPSSLPAQPTIFISTSSSSAASSAEPSTSSSASNSNSFTSAEYDKIDQVSDKLFSSYPRENDFSVIVLCLLYVQALRTHFMTQKFFQSRSIYRRLHNFTTYKDHRNVLCKFSEGNTSLQDVRENFPKVTGIETISNALQSMFMGRAFTILPNMQLPTKPPKKS